MNRIDQDLQPLRREFGSSRRAMSQSSSQRFGSTAAGSVDHGDALEVTVARGLSGLQEIAPEWGEIVRRLSRRRFFHWYGWYRSYLSVLEPDPAAVYFFVLRAGSRPVAIVPLKAERQRRLGIALRVLTLPPHAHLPLRDVLCASDVAAGDVVESLLRFLREQRFRWDVIRFADVMHESPLAALRSERGWRVLVRPAKTCDFVVCDRPYDTIMHSFSKNFRSNLNYARNKLAKESGVEFESVLKPGLDMNRCFADFLELEASGWKGREGTGTAIKLHPELLRFYESLIAELSPAGEVVLNCLRVAGAPIAAHFCVRDEDTLYVLKIAYDERHARLAPGNMLLERVIQSGIASGSFRHVNLVGDPPWFKVWRPHEMPVYTIELYNGTAAGLALLAIKRAKQWLRSMLDYYWPRPARP
jgi:CelD/BcsL family acetyltransferase involved in cellulose biosynthesis